jgi:hypothetical protein
MKKLIGRLALALSLATGVGAAHAAPTVIDFDGGLDDSLLWFPPFVTHGDFMVQGDYFVGTASTKSGAIESSSASPGDLVGALVEGTDVAATCLGIVCPTNNASRFLLMANDGLPWFGRLDGDVFQIKSLDASFVGAAGATIPSVAMILRVYGFFADSTYAYEDILLPGMSNGALGFRSYAFSDAFASNLFVEVDFYGYACDSAGSCNRSSNLAQFALDNVVLNDASTAVPEPASLALVMLALAGAGTVRRRRGQAA